MSPFWQGFFNVFGRKMDPIKLPPNPFALEHNGEWWSHPFWNGRFSSEEDALKQIQEDK